MGSTRGDTAPEIAAGLYGLGRLVSGFDDPEFVSLLRVRSHGSSTFEDIGTTVTYSGGGIFSDGFERGDVSMWSSAVGD